MDGSLVFPSLTSGDDITSTAHLTAEPVTGPERVRLPLLLTAESLEDPPRVWRRRVPVPITRPPRRSALF
jgi:hypothetical protein